MTANQIAAASQREDARHNDVVEVETNRHNTEMERLENKSLDYTREYNQQKMELEKQLNALNLEYSYASLEKKAALESERNNITYQLGLLQQSYNTEMALIKQSEIDSANSYRNQMSQVAWFDKYLQQKRDYYENQKTEATTTSILANIDLAKQKLKQEQDRIDNDWALGILSQEQRDKQLQLAQKEYELAATKWVDAQSSETKASTYLKWVQAAHEASKIGSDWVDALIPW